MESIGIIGGADGPTAIFITSSVSPKMLTVLAIGVVVMAVLGFLLHHHNK